MRLVFVGNFSSPHSTENELKWTFEHLGWEVTPLQENDLSTLQVLNACQGADLFLWVRTHSWEIIGDVAKMVNQIKDMGVVSFAVHLDRYWGLDKLDRRESLIGKHPWWKLDYIFTADGGNQQGFKDRGVNHHWIEPAVVERDCYFGTPRYEYIVDVGFVGSKSYHPEYPQRTKLIEWLEQTYGDRFIRFAGDAPSGTIRGKDLNDLYASIKVVVGDSCFAGAPFYWSDRVPETLGRGGFLIHPASDGLSIDGLVTYPAGDWEYLKDRIDHFLENEQERLLLRDKAFDEVRTNHTYTNRVMSMLDTMGVV